MSNTNESVISTEIVTRATASLDQEIQDELNKSDPQPEKAKAALREAINASKK